MNKTTTAAKIRPDGTVVEILDDGTERPFPKTPMRPMTEAEVAAAAAADPDARADDARTIGERRGEFRASERCGARSD
jgi:putative transcriptional regulator